MAITFTLVQQANALGNPAVPTLGAGPTAGNILLVVANERSGTAHASFVVDGSWTKLGGHDNEIGNANARMSIAAWFKKATGSEGTSPVSVDNGTANNIRALVLELAPSEAVDAYVEAAEATAGGGTGGDSPLAIGATGSVAAANYLIAQFIGWRNGGGDIGSLSWDNSPDDDGFVNGAINGLSLGWGFKDDATGGTYSATATWTSTAGGDEHAGMIFAIEAQTGGGGGGGNRRRRVLMGTS